MDYGKQISTSMWILILLRTIGAVDMPGLKKKENEGVRKLPAPRTYLVVVIAWSTLGLMDDAGMGRAAATIGWVLDLAALLLAPFGTSFLRVLQGTVELNAPPSQQVQPSSSPQTVIPSGYTT